MDLALPFIVGVPPVAQGMPAAASPHLAVPDSSAGSAEALAPGRPLRHVTLHVTSNLYNGLRHAALFDVHMHGWLLGALANTGAGSSRLNWVSRAFQTSLAPSTVHAGRLSIAEWTGVSHTPPSGYSVDETIKADEDPSRLALWKRPPLGSVLRCVVFPSGAHWELEQGEMGELSVN
ncbi:hypothetical protein H4582DRAFT_1110015 [Lactarius indigo]|nr:hypothetical protein H4582DRAFT_1110015 [Lactarius indigo]